MASSGAFWAADAIATQLQANAAAVRANSVLKNQQGYHCGDLGIRRAALAELQRLDPNNPLLIAVVQKRIYTRAERTFWRHGWDDGSTYEADPQQVHAELLIEFEAARAVAIAEAQGESVKQGRRGLWFLSRRTVFVWRGVEHATSGEALNAQQAELCRLENAKLGDKLK